MKRFVKVLLVAAVMVLSLGAVSCGEGLNAPEGMQLARGGEEEGYYFFVPDGWVVANYGDYASAYVSKANPTTVTFAEAVMPEYGKDGLSADEARQYFSTSMANLGYTKNVNPSANGEAAAFGNASGFKFDFTYDYPREDGGVINYRTLQYIIPRGERLYIFQYTSRATVPEYSVDGMTYYDIYLETADNTVNASDVIAQFVFLDTAPTKTVPEAKSSGELVLVSDKATAGFAFYAPKDSVAITSTALVHHDLGDGSSVAVSELVLTTTATHPDQYFEGIRVNMEKAFGEVKRINVPTEENGNRIEINGANWGYEYEYTYTYAGVEYRGYTVIIGKQSGIVSRKYYAFTYSAKAGAYNGDLVDAMIEKLEF